VCQGVEVGEQLTGECLNPPRSRRCRVVLRAQRCWYVPTRTSAAHIKYARWMALLSVRKCKRATRTSCYDGAKRQCCIRYTRRRVDEAAQPAMKIRPYAQRGSARHSMIHEDMRHAFATNPSFIMRHRQVRYTVGVAVICWQREDREKMKRQVLRLPQSWQRTTSRFNRC